MSLLKRQFHVPFWYVESGIIRKGGPMDKATRTMMLEHLMSMSFEPAPPREIVTMESVAVEDGIGERA
jgi:hypothetical protein